MPTACIALGSNLGDRAANLRRAVALLNDPPDLRVTAVSEFLETAPEHCPPGSPPFLNAAAVVETALAPRELLDRLMAIESSLGRHRSEDSRNAPRTIDLDVLFYDDLVLAEPGLVIPHPRLHERRFVLEPLAQVAPHFRHPRLRRTVGELLEELSRAGE